MKWTLSDPRICFTSDSKDAAILPVSAEFVNTKKTFFCENCFGGLFGF